MSKAAALARASKSILPLACAASASGASLNFDYFGSGIFDNSGWFISTLTTPANGGGLTQGTGFKLYGSDTLDDSAFYYYDSYYNETQPLFDGDGLGLLWGGSINGSLAAGDVLSAPYEFEYSFTHTPAFPGDSYVSNPWNLSLGLISWQGNGPFDWATEAGSSGFGSIITVSSELGYADTAGNYRNTGTINLSLDEFDLEFSTPTHWFVRLTVLLEHENDYWGSGPGFPKWNGDTLTVTVPQNSIDLAYIPVPEPTSLFLTALGGLSAMRRRRSS